jgi:hypothetical protein
MKKRLITVAAGAIALVSLGACSPAFYIQQAFGPAAPQATRVATCESGLNPGAVSPGGGNHGLFQINSVHRDQFARVTGRAFSPNVYDPQANVKYAKWLYDQQGWHPWTCKP